MSLQKNVELYRASGVAGDIASQNPVIYTPQNWQADGIVKIGSFVWRSATLDGCVSNTGTGAPLGFVDRRMVQRLLNEEGSNVVFSGDELAVAVRGDFFIVADATPTLGATVYANTATGEATLTQISGTTEDSGFKVVDLGGGASGDTIIISNWA